MEPFNATFIVQAANFIVAYVILDRLVLRHVLHEMYQDKAEAKNSLDLVQKEQAMLKDAQHSSFVQWHDFQKNYLQHAPSVDAIEKIYHAFSSHQSITLEQLPNEQDLIATCERALVKEIDHVR